MLIAARCFDVFEGVNEYVGILKLLLVLFF
jgi:hypothetical protein